MGEVRARVAHAAHGFELVTSTEGILLGRLRRTTLASIDHLEHQGCPAAAKGAGVHVR